MQMTKKVLSLVLAVLMVVSMMSVMAVGTATVASAATAKTVYFAKPSGWSTVNCYAWDANDAAVSAEWPGDSATFAYTNDYNEDVYSYSVPSTATGIIFNDGSNQTADITSFDAYEQFYIDNGSVNSVQLVAKVGTKLYASFAGAVNAANGSLINVLVKDATPYVMTVGQSIVTDNYTKITVQAPAGKAIHRAYDGTAKTYTFTVVDPVASYSDGTTTYYYDSLSAAVSAVPNATGTGTYTVNLLSDSTEASIVVGSALAKKNIDFNLGGHTLTLTRNYGNLFYARNGSHVSVDNGKVVFDTAYANGNGFVIDSAAATLNLGSDLDVVAKGTTSGISVFGGTVTSAADISAEDSFAIATNGSKTPASASITINGGTITSDTIAIYQPGANSLTINNADVTGTTALYVKGGDVTINGGSYTGTGAKADYSYNGNGANATGDAIVVENAGSAYPANDVTIKNDAALSSTNGGYGLGAYTKNDEVAVEVALDNVTVPTAYGDENANFTFANGAAITDIAVPADCKVVTDSTTGEKTVVPKDYVAQVGDDKYESLAEAIAAAGAGDTVKLLADVGRVTVPAGKDIVLDLNGKTVSGGYYGIVNNGTLTVEGPGTVSGTYGVYAGANSTTTINGGTFNAQECAVATFKNTTGATINITGGTFTTADNSVLSGNGSANSGNNTWNVSGGTFNGNITTAGYVAAGIYAPNDDTWNITGGTFNVTNGVGIAQRAGNVTISGDAEFNVTGDGTKGKVGDSRVVLPAGTALVYDSSANYPGQDEDAELSVTGGTFNAEYAAAAGTEDDTRVAIAGGTFDKPVPEDCCAEGKIPAVLDETTGTYSVKNGTYVAEVNGTKYETVAEAITAAGAGDTVTLLADVTGPVTVPADKEIVLDLNSKTISGGYYGIVNNGTLTVEGPGTVSGTYGVRAGSNSTTTINGGTFNAQECAVATFKNTTGATINITGGTFTTADNSVLSGNGSANSGNNTWNVSGGTFNGNITTAGYVAAGIYAPNDDTWNITGGTFNVTNGVGIAQRAGNVTISGDAEFNVTGDGTKGKVGDSRVVLPAGTALVYDSSANYPAQDDDAELSVTGGTFNASYAAAAGTEDDTRVAIEGGTFDKAVAENCCAEGFKPTEVDANGKYTVTLRGWEAAFENATYSYDWSSSSYRHVKVVLSNNGTALTAKADYEAQKDLWEVTYSPASGVVNSSSVTAKEGYMDISFKSAADGVVTITYSLKSDPTVTASTTVTINPVITGISTAKPALVQNGANAISELRVNGSAVNVNDYNFSTENTDIATIDGANITPSKAGTVTVKVYKKSAPETMIGTRNIVFTDTAVAKNGDTYYGTLASALSGAANNSTIELISNVATTSASSLSTGNTVTLDLCGYEVNSTSSTSAIRVSNGTLTVKDTDGSGKVANTNGYAFISGAGAAGNTANLVIESGTFEGLSTVAQAGVKTGTNSNPKYFPGNVEIKGGTFTATADTIGGVDFTLNKVDQVRDDSTISVTGGTFTGFDPANNTAEGAGTNFVADGYKSVNNGDGTYTVVEDDPLAPVLKEAENEITAAVARDLDGNLFGLDDNLQYKVGAILGVQRKNVIETNVADEGLRFVAEIDTELAKRSDVDYGFVMTKVSGDNISTANFGEERFNQYLTVEKAGTTCSKFSCKGGTNTVVPQKYYGDPNSDESHKYTYVTYAVTNVASGKGVAARFYVTIGDKTYYANYTGTDYSGICSPDPTKLS